MNNSNINYDISFHLYTKEISRMAVGSIKRTGIKKIAKSVLLLSVIKGIEDGTFKTNRFEYEQITKIYEVVFKKYANLAKQNEYTQPYYPFYHLQSSNFWHLNFLSPNSIRKPSAPTTAWVRNNIEYAYLDPALWDMLQDKEYRHKLAEFIIEEKIKTATAGCRSMLRMFFGWLIAI